MMHVRANVQVYLRNAHNANRFYFVCLGFKYTASSPTPPHSCWEVFASFIYLFVLLDCYLFIILMFFFSPRLLSFLFSFCSWWGEEKKRCLEIYSEKLSHYWEELNAAARDQLVHQETLYIWEDKQISAITFITVMLHAWTSRSDFFPVYQKHTKFLGWAHKRRGILELLAFSKKFKYVYACSRSNNCRETHTSREWLRHCQEWTWTFFSHSGSRKPEIYD